MVKAQCWSRVRSRNRRSKRRWCSAAPRSLHLPGDRSKVDLQALMKALAARSINEVHVEAGFKLNGSIVGAGLADELLVYFAPSLLGEAQGMLHLPALSDLAQAQTLEVSSK